MDSEVSAIDGVEAWSPGQIQTAETRHYRGVRIVIRHVQVVSAVERLLQGFLRCGGFLGQTTTPVAAEVPVRAGDAGDVAAENHAEVGAVHTVGAVTEGLDRI